MKLQLGIRRLILIESGNHRFSIFPIDQPVSIYGRNNLGKSQSINALQFILFKNSREMDFLKYDASKSKEFYFKSEYSMVITEIMTNEGIFLLGAAGKGPMHEYDYQHFLVKTHYKKSDFFDGENHLKARDVFNKFEANGTPVKLMTPEHVRQALTGNFHAAQIKYDITLLPIREATESRIAVYNKIYRNMLTMKQTSDRDIKEIVLEVFSNVLANTKVDFMKVKAEAFREHDSLNGEIFNLNDNKLEIGKLAEFYKKREHARKELGDIKSRLRQISQIRLNQIPLDMLEANNLKAEKEELIKNARKIFERLMEEREKSSAIVIKMNTYFEGLEKQRSNFSILVDSVNGNLELAKADLDKSVNFYSGERSTLAKQLENSQNRDPKVITDEIARLNDSIESNQAILDSHSAGGDWMDEMGYSIEQKKKYSRVLNPKFMALSKNLLFASDKTPNIFDNAFEIDGNQFISDSVTVDISSIRAGAFKEIDPDHIKAQIAYYEEQIEQLRSELEVSQDIEASKDRLANLDIRLNDEIKARAYFISYIENLECEEENKDLLIEHKEAVAGLSLQLSSQSENNTEHQREIDKLQARLVALGQELSSVREVGKLNFFQDQDLEFAEVDPVDIPGGDALYVSQLIENGQNCYGQFRGSDAEFNNSRNRILTRYSKHSAEQDDAEIVRKLNEEIESLPEKISLLAKLHHEAIVRLANALNSLEKNYQRLDAQIHEFNRKINSRKVSNLKSFKVVLLPNVEALDSIRTLMKSIDVKAIDLFSAAASAEAKIDATVNNNAIQYLGNFVNELGGTSLTLSELFRMSFEIEDSKGNKTLTESFDKNASNGTSMTIKALFNMNLLRYLYDDRSQTIHMPFYVDEATNIDEPNRIALNAMSADLGFTPIYASVDPVATARYNVNLEEAQTDDGLILPEEAWIRISDKEIPQAEEQKDMF